MKRFQQTFLLLTHFFAFLLCFAVFYIPFGLQFPFLFRPSRTSVITIVSFAVVYLLMTKVYGSMEIGTKKAKPIIYSFVVKLFVTDLVAHFFLCVMNVTVVNDGHFVYESPWLLLIIYVAQLLLVAVVAYLGNDIYFHFNSPAKCLIIHPVGDECKSLLRQMGRLKKQYKVSQLCPADAPDLFNRIDAADAVFIYNLTASERVYLVEYCFRQRKEIYYSTEIQDIVALGSQQVLFGDIPIIHYGVKGLTFEQRIMKRTLDIVVSALGLLITSPIMLITALAIKLEDHGSVFYKQPRMTYGGRVFHVLKFRSMREESGSIHRSVSKDDDRITKVGHIIRKFRIDELPQLINILKSDMSLVGPRPEMVENMQKYTQELPEFAYRLRAKAGLTGLAQIYGKYNTSPPNKLAMDLTYIEQYSFWLDIKLILRTALVLLSAEESTEEFENQPSE